MFINQIPAIEMHPIAGLRGRRERPILSWTFRNAEAGAASKGRPGLLMLFGSLLVLGTSCSWDVRRSRPWPSNIHC